MTENKKEKAGPPTTQAWAEEMIQSGRDIVAELRFLLEQPPAEIMDPKERAHYEQFRDGMADALATYDHAKSGAPGQPKLTGALARSKATVLEFLEDVQAQHGNSQ